MLVLNSGQYFTRAGIWGTCCGDKHCSWSVFPDTISFINILMIKKKVVMYRIANELTSFAPCSRARSRELLAASSTTLFQTQRLVPKYFQHRE